MLGVVAGSIIFKLSFFNEPEYTMPIDVLPWGLGGAIYIIGAGIYVARVPERCKPGKFNVFGHSHQLFHFCVVTACIIHY
jgi:channel protein (hemolysin III family)